MRDFVEEQPAEPAFTRAADHAECDVHTASRVARGGRTNVQDEHASPAFLPSPSDWNPRFIAFAKAMGVHHAVIEQGARTNVRFIIWLGERWREWAAELGFTRGLFPQEDARFAGRTHAEFDAWLARKVG